MAKKPPFSTRNPADENQVSLFPYHDYRNQVSYMIFKKYFAISIVIHFADFSALSLQEYTQATTH